MSLITLGTSSVLSGSITRPLKGAWTADVVIDAATAPTGLTSLNGNVCTVVRSHEFADRISCRVVGGKGGLGRLLPAKFYRSTTARAILTDTLAAAGETLSATSSAAVVNGTVTAWQRAQGTAAEALDAMCARVPGATWRVLPDGPVWVGVPAFAARALDYAQLDEDLADGRIDAATDDLALDAGVTVDGRRIGRVRYTFDSGSVRVSWWAATGSVLDRFKGSLTALIESVLGKRLDYRAWHPAKVVMQHSDGTLDVVPDGSRISSMTKVPIRYGVPGISATIATGARVLVGFAGGDPASPIATVWESASVTELNVNASLVKLAGGARPVACEGDLVTVILTPAHLAAATTAPIPVTGYILNTTNKTRT